MTGCNPENHRGVDEGYKRRRFDFFRVQATSQLHLVDLDSLVDLERSAEAKQALEDLLNQLLEPISQLSEAISNSHFSHAETPRQLINMQTSV